MQLARWWHKTENGRYQCELCPRHCTLKPGQHGFCFVREAHEDGMVLATYGRSSGFCIDPIEKKPLNHFYPGSSVFSFGTAGCNLGCKFCQNWDISKAKTIDRLNSEASPSLIAQAAKQFDCKSVAFTYNDPVIFAEYAIDTAHSCHDLGLKTVAVSAGYISAIAREEFFSVIDAANIDLKGFTEEFYQKYSSVHLAPILETLEYLAQKTNVWLEVTTLLIPGINDSIEEIDSMTKWIRDHLGSEVPLHFSAFHPDFQMMDTPPTPPEILFRSREIAMKNGLKFVYTGNIHDIKGATTYCPNCHKEIIKRDWYDILSYNIKNSGCGFCGHKLKGFFEDSAGTWNAQCVPIDITRVK